MFSKLIKKSLGFLAVLTMTVSLSPLAAHAAEVGFLEGAVNLSSLENYRAVESFSGAIQTDTGLDISFRLNTSNSVDNDSSPAAYSQMNLSFEAVNTVETPEMSFKKLSGNLALTVVSQGEEDIYFRVNDLKFNVDQPSQAMTEGVMPMIELVKSQFQGVWQHWNLESLNQDLSTFSTGPMIDQATLLEFSKAFKEDPKKAFADLIKQSMIDAGETLSTEDNQLIDDIVDLFFETKFFNTLDIVSGNNAGFKFFTLNRAGVISFVQGVAGLMGEELTAEEIMTTRQSLNKLTVSGIYHVDQTSGILDNFVLRMQLRDVEALKRFDITYQSKITNTTSKNVIEIPTNFVEFSL